MKPILKGKRIELRSMVESDACDLFEIYGDKAVMQYASDPVFESLDMIYVMLDSVRRLELSNESLEWAVVQNDTSKVIGTCGLHSFSDSRKSCEIGCLLNSSYWRQGYMSEAVLLLLEFAMSLGITQIIADIDRPNYKSIGLFAKLGFKQQHDGKYCINL